MKVSKMMVFRVLKWLSVAIGILIVIAFVDSAETASQKTSVFTAATFFILFAVFFHLEQHKS